MEDHHVQSQKSVVIQHSGVHGLAWLMQARGPSCKNETPLMLPQQRNVARSGISPATKDCASQRSLPILAHLDIEKDVSAEQAWLVSEAW